MNQIAKSSAALICVFVSALAVTDGSAQELQFASQSGPYYVGEPVLVQVIASGFGGGDNPQCQLAGSIPDGLSIQGPHVGRSTSSLTQIINGRVSRRDTVDVRFSFVVTAGRKGEFDIGPFEVTSNGKTNSVEGAKFRFRDLEVDPDMEIGFSILGNSIYVGQQVPVTIRWSFIGDFNAVKYAFSNLQIRSPLFDQFSFRDKPRQTRTTLTLATAKGSIDLDAQVTQEEKDGKQVVVVTGQRILMADLPGEYKSIPITCRTKKVTRWGRDLFGEIVARGTAPSLAAGEPLSFSVKPVPLSGRPESFAGAVGQGFSIEVAANRSVVRVGDPISLTITLRGSGNLDSVSLPQLDTASALARNDFQILGDQSSGTVDGNTKHFKVNIRVKNQSVNQIPAIEFSWFDPIQEVFDTSRSKPIALQVMDTEIISSQDVVATTSKHQGANNQESTNSADGQAEPAISLAGANLAIERDPALLLANHDQTDFVKYVPGAIYGLAILLGMVALLRKPRSAEEIATKRRKSQLSRIRKSIQNANSRASKDAAADIAESLREFIKVFEPKNRAEVDLIISDCDNATYSPSEQGGQSFTESLIERSLAVVDDIEMD